MVSGKCLQLSSVSWMHVCSQQVQDEKCEFMSYKCICTYKYGRTPIRSSLPITNRRASARTHDQHSMCHWSHQRRKWPRLPPKRSCSLDWNSTVTAYIARVSITNTMVRNTRLPITALRPDLAQAATTA